MDLPNFAHRVTPERSNRESLSFRKRSCGHCNRRNPAPLQRLLKLAQMASSGASRRQGVLWRSIARDEADSNRRMERSSRSNTGPHRGFCSTKSAASRASWTLLDTALRMCRPTTIQKNPLRGFLLDGRSGRWIARGTGDPDAFVEHPTRRPHESDRTESEVAISAYPGYQLRVTRAILPAVHETMLCNETADTIVRITPERVATFSLSETQTIAANASARDRSSEKW